MSEEYEPHVKIRKMDKIDVIPILAPNLTSLSVETTTFVALKLEDKRIIGNIVKSLKELPENLRHLKRVGNNGQVLIAGTFEEAQKLIKIFDTNLGITSDDLEEVIVPSSKPISRGQFSAAKLIWPTGFHPDKSLENLLDGSFKTCQLIEYTSKWSQEVETKQCIAVQNEEYLCEGSSMAGPLRHSIMEMVGKMPKREKSSENYLGTGCDVFLRDEPCAMCAMALVHFRVKRVFYNRKSKNGVLSGEGWQLHLEPSINHHYEVYRIDHPNWNNHKPSICGCT